MSMSTSLSKTSALRRASPSPPTIQRWLTTTTTRKRRKPKTLAPPSHPGTTRDRVRWLRDRNQIFNDNYYQFKSLQRKLEDFGDTAEKRLYWMREKFFSFWRDEGATDPTQKRKRRVGLKMDAKWWFWNILFALFPSVLLASYCQFIALPKMIEFNKKMRIQEQREALGHLYVEEEDQELARLERYSTPIYEKLYDAVQELTLYFVKQEIPDQTPTLPGQKLQTETAPSAVSQPVAIPTATPVHRQPESEEAQTIAELKQKLDALERRHKEKEINESKGKPNSSQSRIRQRVMQERNEEARKREEARVRQAEGNERGDSVWSRLYETSKHYYSVLSNSGGSDEPERVSSKEATPTSDAVAAPKQERQHEATKTQDTRNQNNLTVSKPTKPVVLDESKSEEQPISIVSSDSQTSDNASETPLAKDNNNRTKRSWWSGWRPK